MIRIQNGAGLARTLALPIDPDLKSLLITRRDQLLADTGGEYDIGDLAHFVIVEPPDTASDIEAAVGFPLLDDPPFEWVADHGGWYEAVVVLSDDGFGLVLLAPDQAGVDPALLGLLRSNLTYTSSEQPAGKDPERPSLF